MSDNLNSNIELNQTIDKSKLWFINNKENLVNHLSQMGIWTQLAIGTSILELGFSKIPLISIPNAILDVGGGLGNLFQQINSKNIKPSDIIGLGNSIVTFVGAFAISASIGIESSLIGLNLIRISSLTTPIGVGLFALGYALDHHKEIKAFLGNEAYNLLKEQYFTSVNLLDDTKEALKTYIGEALFNAATNINQDNFDKIFTSENNEILDYNFDNLDPGSELNLKEKINISPSDLYHSVNEISAEINSQPLTIDDLETSTNPLVTETTINEPKLENPLQDLFLSIDMSNTNLELVHMTKEDLKSSSLYTVKGDGQWTTYVNNKLPWLHENIFFIEVKGKFYLYNHYGSNKGITFPLFFDKTTKLPLGLPLNEFGDFTEVDTLEVLKNTPHLFNEPGHINNNMALQIHMLNSMTLQTTMMHTDLGINAIHNHLQNIKVINIADVVKINNDQIQGLNDKINPKNEAALSTTSGNALQGKYCFPYTGIDTSDIEDPTGGNHKIIVEICFDKNPYLSQFE